MNTGRGDFQAVLQRKISGVSAAGGRTGAREREFPLSARERISNGGNSLGKFVGALLLESDGVALS